MVFVYGPSGETKKKQQQQQQQQPPKKNHHRFHRHNNGRSVRRWEPARQTSQMILLLCTC
jgi:hypothetical protein